PCRDQAAGPPLHGRPDGNRHHIGDDPLPGGGAYEDRACHGVPPTGAPSLRAQECHVAQEADDSPSAADPGKGVAGSKIMSPVIGTSDLTSNIVGSKTNHRYKKEPVSVIGNRIFLKVYRYQIPNAKEPHHFRDGALSVKFPAAIYSPT